VNAPATDITVAVATCGRPHALARCLTALAAGTLLPPEVIVVDQSPTPEARHAALTVSGLCVRYLEQQRLGLSASRNLALVTATTPLLAVTDDDCVPQQGWVEALDDAFAREPRPAAVTGSIVSLGNRPPGMHPVSLRTSTTLRDHVGRMLPWRAGSGANFAAPLALLRRLGGWDQRLGVGSPGRAAEDSDLIYRILRAGGIVRYDPAAIVAHDWQSWSRRLDARWSYGYGIGALCGSWLRCGDPYALRMLAAYVPSRGHRLASAVLRRDRRQAAEYSRALSAVAPGLLYGLRAPRRSPGEGLS